MLQENPNTPLIEIYDQKLLESKIKLFIKREDLIDPEISGNKWYKLKYNLLEAKELGHKKILTFGGAYSNHIYSTAAAGKRFGFETIGVIRGEEHLPLNPTLSFAKACGMKFHYLDRNSYRNKYDKGILKSFKIKYGDFYLIPEGGSNSLAVEGCSEIIPRIKIKFDFICTACGTGGTLAGLVLGLNSKSKAIGFSVLKGGNFLNNNAKSLLSTFDRNNFSNWEINLNYHFGGYAKVTNELVEFCNEFTDKHKIEIEPIYTGKMLYGIFDLIKKKYFPMGSTIVVIHSGGLQGLKGLEQRGILKNYS
jgi:1-aminocyclopropane-1-carboxylate deaminase/D-cysteine desulfhydrase-like pyridoxal-dependent ACC family enzyme